MARSASAVPTATSGICTQLVAEPAKQAGQAPLAACACVGCCGPRRVMSIPHWSLRIIPHCDVAVRSQTGRCSVRSASALRRLPEEPLLIGRGRHPHLERTGTATALSSHCRSRCRLRGFAGTCRCHRLAVVARPHQQQVRHPERAGNVSRSSSSTVAVFGRRAQPIHRSVRMRRAVSPPGHSASGRTCARTGADRRVRRHSSTLANATAVGGQQLQPSTD